MSAKINQICQVIQEHPILMVMQIWRGLGQQISINTGQSTFLIQI